MERLAVSLQQQSFLLGLFALQYAVCTRRCNERRMTVFTAAVRHAERRETSCVWCNRSWGGRRSQEVLVRRCSQTHV